MYTPVPDEQEVEKAIAKTRVAASEIKSRLDRVKQALARLIRFLRTIGVAAIFSFQ